MLEGGKSYYVKNYQPQRYQFIATGTVLAWYRRQNSKGITGNPVPVPVFFAYKGWNRYSKAQYDAAGISLLS